MGKFKPGNSGGPGRPPGSRNGSTVAKEFADAYGIDFLIKVAEGEKVFEAEVTRNKKTIKIMLGATPAMRIAVTIYLIDRAYGRPTAARDPEAGGLTLEQLVAASRREETDERCGEEQWNKDS